MKIVVTGGRDYGNAPDERDLVFDIMNGYYDPDLELAHGGAPGLDTCVSLWFNTRFEHEPSRLGYTAVVYLADWQRYGKGAGHARNGRMLDEFKPDLLVSFPGGRGTLDCEVQAHDKRILIHRYDKQGKAEVIKPEFDLMSALSIDQLEDIDPDAFDINRPVGRVVSTPGPGMVNVQISNGSTPPGFQSLVPGSIAVPSHGPITPGTIVELTLNGIARPIRHN